MVTALARYVRSHHVGLVALFIALGGTAYAATLPRNSVGPKQLKRGAVTSVKVRDGALRPADFAPGTLRSGPQGPAGPRGLTGPRGSDAQFNGAAAGGDLEGTFPNPTLRAPGAGARQGPGEFQTIPDGPPVDIGNGGSGKLMIELYDTGDLHDVATNPDRFTAQRAGVYLVSASGTFSPDPDGSRAMAFAVGGSFCCGAVQIPAASAPTPLTTSAIVTLNTGESVTLRAGVPGAGNAVSFGDVVYAIHWLGPAS